MTKQNKGRKLFAASATAALVAAAIVPVASAAQVNDFNKVSGYAKEAVQSLVDNDVIQGDEKGNFNPTSTVTRAEAAQIFVNALELTAEGTVNFSDVKSSAWYYDAIAAAVENGIFEGVSATQFAPSKSLTRSEAAKILVEAFDLSGEANLSQFDDASSIKGWAKPYLEIAVANGIFEGSPVNGKTNLNPNASITRQDFAVVFSRTLGLEDVETVDASVKAINNTTVEVTFDEEVTDVKALDFAIEGLEVKNAAVKQTNKKVVVLTTAAQTADTAYTVTLAGEKIGSFKGLSAVIPSKVDIVEKSVQGKLGQQVTVKAQVTVAEGASKAGIPVTLFVPGSADGIKAPVTVEALTDENGVATHTYTRYAATTDTLTVYATGDRSKFSTGYVFWGVDSIITVEEVTTGATINNNSNKTYKVTYKNPTTGKTVANKELNVSFVENINVAANEAKNATVNGVAAKQLTNNTAPKTAVITTDSKGEATFTVSGANTEVTPVVFDLNADKANGKEYASYYEADLLQVIAPKVKFGALQAAYSIELTRDGEENAAFGHENGRKYKVLVKDKDGKVAKNETVNIAFNEDIDRVISTNTKAKFVELNADGKQIGFYGKDAVKGNSESKITVKTNDKGEATFVIGSQTGNVDDYATPVAWIDINNSSAKDGQLDEGEPTTVGKVSYFEKAKLTSGKLVAVDSKDNEEDKFKADKAAKFQFQLTNQSGKKIAIGDTNGYDTISATFTVSNTGDNDVEVTANGETVTVAPNREYTVTAKDSATPSITVTPADFEKSAAVKVTANAIVKDLEGNTELKPFTITTTSETKVSFTGTKEVGNLEKGIIESFNTDKNTFTIVGKDAVKYADVDGKTFVYRDTDNRPMSLNDFEKELKEAKTALEIAYEIKDNEITFYLKSVSGNAPVDEVENAGVTKDAVKLAADSISSTLSVDNGELDLSALATGYTVAIKSSDKPAVISLDGTVTPQDAVSTVKVVLTVTTKDGKYSADTKEITVTVASKDSSAQKVAENNVKEWTKFFAKQDSNGVNAWPGNDFDGNRDLAAWGLTGTLVAEKGKVVYKVAGKIAAADANKLAEGDKKDQVSLAVYVGGSFGEYNKVAKYFAAKDAAGAWNVSTETPEFKDVAATKDGKTTITFTLDFSGVTITP